MSMTAEEVGSWRAIMKLLGNEGHPRYADILADLDLNLTNDPKVVAYLEPAKSRIVVNRNLTEEYVSFVIRHEILHWFLRHEKRMLDHLALKSGLDPKKVDDMTLDLLKKELYKDSTFNYAADWEISNRGYTWKDKRLAKSLMLNGQKLKGLVTDIDHKDWTNLSVEEMYDKLLEDEKFMDQMKQEMQQQQQQGGDGQQGDGQQGQQDNQSGNKDKQSGSGGTPRLGDKGDSATQAAEDAERAANAVVNDAGEKVSPQDMKDMEDNLSKMSKAEQDAKKKEFADKVQDRVKKIMDKLRDPNLKKQIEDDVERQKDEEVKKAYDELHKRYTQTGNYKFKMDLLKFIKDTSGFKREKSDSRFNKTYVNTGMIIPGYTYKSRKPLINMYVDQSPSWNDSDIEMGAKVISSIMSYKNNGNIDLKIYYFSNIKVPSTSVQEARSGNGTTGTPIVNHINKTKPQNVIIMTDGDIYDILKLCKVPGAVWLLFKNGVRSHNVLDNIKGNTLTKVYDISEEAYNIVSPEDWM